MCRSKGIIVWLGVAASTLVASALALYAAPAAAATIGGTVYGTALGVSGATVTIFAANSNGASSVGSGTTDMFGGFSFSFTNPGGNNVLYAVATGGDLGQGANSAIALMAVPGTGSSFEPSVTIDEFTTIASAWSMAQFIHSDGSISGPSPGLENAAATVPSLVFLPAGVPTDNLLTNFYNTPTKLISLADILIPCIVSSGPASAACGDLFKNATPAGGAAPTNTLAAAINIAQHPTMNVAALFAISQSDPVFVPALTQAPPAWTLSLEYSGGGLHAPIAVAVDGDGNIWAGNFGASGGLTKLRPGGVPDPGSPFLGGGLGGPRGLDGVAAIAIDGSGHIWAANAYPENTVSELDLNGNPISPDTGYATSATGNESRYFQGIAADRSGNVWLTDFINNSLVEMSSGGELLSPPGDFRGGGILFPTGLAVDGSGRVWVANHFIDVLHRTVVKPGSVSAFDSAGNPVSPKKGYTKGGIAVPTSFAIDNIGDVWIADQGFEAGGKLDTGAATKLSAKGSALSKKKGFQGGGIFQPDGIAVDGAGNVWLVDGTHPGAECPVSELDPKGAAISPPVGYLLDGFCDSQKSMAIDPSGNIWIANTGINTIIEMVGAASPVKTPIIGPVSKL